MIPRIHENILIEKEVSKFIHLLSTNNIDLSDVDFCSIHEIGNKSIDEIKIENVSKMINVSNGNCTVFLALDAFIPLFDKKIKGVVMLNFINIGFMVNLNFVRIKSYDESRELFETILVKEKGFTL